MESIANDTFTADVLLGRRWCDECKGQAAVDLECQISARTAALAQANCALQADLAQRKESEEALRNAEQQYRNIFENAVEGIFQTTPEGRYLRANSMLSRIYGYDSPEELMVAMTDITHQLYLDPRRRAEFSGILQKDDAVWNFESPVYRRDRSVIWISENARAIRADDGRLLGYEGTVVDITARKRAEEELARARQRESEIGARIQQTLLLGQPPADLPGAKVAAFTVPSQQIDGDFFDFLSHDNRWFDVVMGDVMGKGVPAALLGAAIKSRLLHALSHLMYISGTGRLPQPEEIVNQVHSDLTDQFMKLRMFATLCYIRFDLENQRALFVDCGHTKTIHFQSRLRRCVMLEGDNMPLGCSEQECYRQICVPFEAGDAFLFYSDGVTEAQNQAGDFFDVSRVIELTTQHGDLAPEALIANIRAAVIGHSGAETFADDLTCVAVQIAPQEG